MNQSMTETKKEVVFNYKLQVWVINGVIEDCGHRPEHRINRVCCKAHELAGKSINEVK